MLTIGKTKQFPRLAIFAIATMVLSLSCEEKDNTIPPRVLTASVDEITATSALVGGNVSHDGGATITERGVYWGVQSQPETNGTKLVIGSDKGIFYETLSGLTPGVKYYVKAFATNSKATTYGNETFFTTVISFPQVTTSIPEPLSTTSVSVGGEVTSDGGFEVTERGIFWSTSANTQNSGKKIALGSGTGEFSTSLSDLSQGVNYYVRAFAKNIKGMALGNEMNFSTVIIEPSVKTIYPDEVTTNSAIIKGEIEANGGASISERGFYWGTQTDVHTNGTRLPIEGTEASFSSTLQELQPGATYYYVAFATNSVGTAYGDEFSFTTQGAAPDAKTEGYKELKTNSVKVFGVVSANNLSTTIRFEYGTSTSYGNLANSVNSPINENFFTDSVVITGLNPNTTYHFRVVAENQLGTTYGRDTTFTTVLTGITGSVNDVDDNTYETIGIGYKYWTTSNLKTTKLNDGTDIPKAEKDSLWNVLSTAGYSWYNNNSSFAEFFTYGALYNWYTVASGKLCPTGWRVPTEADVSELLDYLDGSSVAGGKLKASGTSQWASPNTDATNEVGFSALPAGKRNTDGLFDFIGMEANWWTMSDYSTHTASYYYVQFNYGNAYQAYANKRTGLSVRCVKD